MESIIQIFRMTEISKATRIRIILQLGEAINNQNGMNITESLVYELVIALDSDNEIKSKERYTRHLKQQG